jgi:hypothetical protein
MPFWEICSGPVYGGEVEVGVGADETDVDELVGVVVGEVLVEVEEGVLLVGAADEVGEGSGSPSHQPKAV